MKFKLKKALALLLSACMLVLVLSMTIVAASPGSSPNADPGGDSGTAPPGGEGFSAGGFLKRLSAEDPAPVCRILDADGEAILDAYDSLAEALAAVLDGQTIQLLDNINYDAGIVITGKSITFDFQIAAHHVYSAISV